MGHITQETADGRSARWADHRATRRAELVQIARHVVHHQGPDASMEEIAVAAATSKSIVYRYFKDKTGLQAAIGQAVVDQMQEALVQAADHADTPRDGLRAMVSVYLEMVEASPNVYYFVTRPVGEPASVPLGHFQDSVATMIATALVREPTAVPDAAAVRAWAAGAVGFVRGAGEWWLTHHGEPDCPEREELAERIATWLWSGLTTDRALPKTPLAKTPTTHRPTTNAGSRHDHHR